MSNWLLRLLGVGQESRRQRADLKRNFDEADARLEEMKRQLLEMGQTTVKNKSALTQTMNGINANRGTAQRH